MRPRCPSSPVESETGSVCTGSTPLPRDLEGREDPRGVGVATFCTVSGGDDCQGVGIKPTVDGKEGGRDPKSSSCTLGCGPRLRLLGRRRTDLLLKGGTTLPFPIRLHEDLV